MLDVVNCICFINKYKTTQRKMISKELIAKLKKIKLLCMDVDGTLTDGAMYYSANGEELKRFSTRDGMGISLIKRGGVATAIITSEDSAIARERALKLRIDNIILGCRNKTEALEKLAADYNMFLENIAYIGDDVNDIHAIKLAGVSACPADAVTQVLENVDYICLKNGGNGAVREFCELILTANDMSIELNENW